MRTRRILAAGVIGVVVAVIAGVGIAFAVAGEGNSPTPSRLAFTHSLARIRAHNIQLQSMLLLLEQEGHGPSAGAESVAAPRRRSELKAVPPAEASPEPAAGEASKPEETECDANYEGACLDPNASDYDCTGGSGNGPEFTGEVTVVGEDHFGLDANGNGIGCESE